MHDPDMKVNFLTVKESAEHLRTTTRKIYLFVKYGMLKPCMFGKQYTFRREALDAFARDYEGVSLVNEEAIRQAKAEHDYELKRIQRKGVKC